MAQEAAQIGGGLQHPVAGHYVGPASESAPKSEAERFINENDLSQWIEIARHLIDRYFRTPTGITIEKREDPELSDEWISMRVSAAGSMDEILDAYDAFTREMVAIVPVAIGCKIRLALGAG